MSYEMLLNEQDISLDILARRPELTIKSGDNTHTVFEMPSGGSEFEIEVDGELYSGYRYVSGDEVYVRIGTRTFIVGLPQASLRAHQAGKTGDALHADMPGTVIALHTEAGAEVKAGDKLITIESMKLQMVLSAPRDGVVAKILRSSGATFEKDEVVAMLEPQDA